MIKQIGHKKYPLALTLPVANRELNQALNDSTQLFKKESWEIIFRYRKNIAAIKANLINEKEDNKIVFERKLAALKQKNEDLKMKLELFKEGGREKWSSFIIKFNTEMKELGDAINDLTLENIQ